MRCPSATHRAISRTMVAVATPAPPPIFTTSVMTISPFDEAGTRAYLSPRQGSTRVPTLPHPTPAPTGTMGNAGDHSRPYGNDGERPGTSQYGIPIQGADREKSSPPS